MERPYNEETMNGVRNYAKYIAIVICNAMEDFHCKHLSDARMEDLNSVMRKAVYTAICVFESRKLSEMSEDFLEFHLTSIPKYWEGPEMLQGLGMKLEEDRVLPKRACIVAPGTRAIGGCNVH